MSAEQPVSRATRKDDHVRLAVAQRASMPHHNEFDDVDLLHHALGAVTASDVDLSVSVGSWHWQQPFYINGMTGGTKQTETINRDLAIAARETGLPMACGSVSIALDDPHHGASRSGFTVIRAHNPDGFVMANLGVGRPADDAKRAVDLLQADALQVHLNAVQETVMPEGSRDFSRWRHSLDALIAASPVPVIVKEVGFGLSNRTLTELSDMGVRLADVSGTGGTDFLRIENARRAPTPTATARFGQANSVPHTATQGYAMLAGYGQSALACLLDAPAHGPQLLASGGIRHPYDAVKAMAAGARAIGVAGNFLETVRAGGAAALTALIKQWLDQTRAILALLGAHTPARLTATDMLVRGRLAEYCRLRAIDTVALARRSTTITEAGAPRSQQL